MREHAAAGAVEQLVEQGGVRLGAPYYDPAWGRWLVALGGGNTRTATAREVAEHKSRIGAADASLGRPTTIDRGK